MKTRKFWLLPALALSAATAYAGYIQPNPVSIDVFEDSGSARGDMITARNSDNDFEFIGCGVRKYDLGNGEYYSWGFCQAQVEEDTSYVCETEDEELMEGMNALATASYISFSWVEEEAFDFEGNPFTYLRCIGIGSSTQSFYLSADKEANKKK